MKKLITVGVLGGMIFSIGLGSEAAAQKGQSGKRKKPVKKKPAEPQTDPSTLPVGVQDMLRTSVKTGQGGTIQAAPGSAPTYGGISQSPKPNAKRALDNGDFGTQPRELVRGEQEKKTGEGETKEAGTPESTPAKANPLEALKQELQNLQEALRTSESSDSPAEKEKSGAIRVKISQTQELIRKMEAELTKSQGDTVPKYR